MAEPYIERLPPQFDKHPHVELATPEEAIRRADIVVLLANHKPFLDLYPLLLQGKVVIDTRGAWQRVG